jgi:hypothetical protein
LGTREAGTALLLGEGHVNANLAAGVNAVVWTLGDVTGTSSAGQDAAVLTYGNFSAGLSAGRDVPRSRPS